MQARQTWRDWTRHMCARHTFCYHQIFFVNKEYSVIFTKLKYDKNNSYLGRLLCRARDVFLELKFPQFLLFPFPSPLLLLPSLPFFLLFPLLLGLRSLHSKSSTIILQTQPRLTFLPATALKEFDSELWRTNPRTSDFFAASLSSSVRSHSCE